MVNGACRKGGWWVMGLMLIAGATVGCDQSVKKQNQALWDENKELRDQLSATREALEAADADRANLVNQLANNKQPTPPPPPPTAPTGFEGAGDVIQKPGSVTVRMEGDVLFASGSATVRTTAQRALNQIAEAIKSKYAVNEIRIEGHTDNDPIRRTKDKWRNNQHLSEARAAAVKDYLARQGVSPTKMVIVGYGETQPRVPNSSRTNKAKNRRVEIVVITKR